jgi:tetratricopeptide (TPR) repeat protein
MKTRSLLSAILFFLFATTALAQDNGYIDSLKRDLELAKTDAARLNTLKELAGLYMTLDAAQADRYALQMQELAEQTRDRKLMVQVLLLDAQRYFAVGAGNREQAAKALLSAEKALALAKTSGLEGSQAEAYVVLSRIARNNGETDKALNYSNLALSLSATTEDDSLRVICLGSLGDTYLAKKERLLAFRQYLQALSIAEALGHYEPLQWSYYNMADFYMSLDDYEKAKDYLFKIHALTLRYGKTLDRLLLYRQIGMVYMRAKQFDIAMEYHQRVLTLSDSIHFSVTRVNGYISILEQYLQSGQAEKALAYFKATPDLTIFMRRANLEFIIFQTYGYTYSKLGRYDSAQYFYAKAEPLAEAHANTSNLYNFYLHLVQFNKDLKKYDKALVYLQKAYRIGVRSGNLEMKQDVSLELDSVYQRMGDFKNAYFYNQRYHQYNDSLKLLSTEKDLMLLEVADEAKRREREELKAEEARHDRHNLQYMGITVAIAAVFIVLVMLGAFRVSKATIKILGFFAFIFLFEFIILIADNQIHHATHGEPWKVMLIKIVLISILLPLHHYLEEKVIHYLTSHRLLENKESLMSKFRSKERAETSTAEPEAH